GKIVYIDTNNDSDPHITPALGSFPYVKNATDGIGAIPQDGSPIIMTMNVNGIVGKLADIDVRLDIDHKHVDQIVAYLESPNGISVPLLRSNGGSAVAVPSLFALYLDDEADSSVTTA